MPDDIFFELHDGLPRQGPGRDRYTERAFRKLPPLQAPDIADIGCGPGGPTVTLARLSGGRVTGIDTHQPFLDQFLERAAGAGVADRVSALNASMFDLPFPDGSFDVVWAEGSIYVIGFEAGLASWRRLLRDPGYLVVHEMCWLRPDPPAEIRDYWKKMYEGISTVPENIEMIERGGYDLLGHFTLPDDAWWIEYYRPLEERLKELREKYAGDPEALATIDEQQKEIDLYRKYQKWYGSVFFVMRAR
ncbi:MAG: class I SAM-dependent methyltransferase [Candidatus Latescibacterota bacterium]|jgi:SAM-dependent methyltransferase